MTNIPGDGWPGAPPPQGSTPPNWGQQFPAQPDPGAPYSGQPNPGAHYPGQSYPGGAPHPGQPHPAQPAAGQPQSPGPGFDPTRALGEQPPPSVSIDQFKPPKNRTPMLITIVALATLAAVVIGGMYIRNQPLQPTPSPSPSTSQRTPSGPGQQFETPNGQQSGTWEILDHEWTDEGLQVQIRITSDGGPITFSFMAFANGTTEVIDPTSSPKTPDLRTGTASPARPSTGYVFFPMSRGDATIILATGSGRQMSALPVQG